jgi:hypothetical protein
LTFVKKLAKKKFGSHPARQLDYWKSLFLLLPQVSTKIQPVGWWYGSMPLTKDQRMVLNLRSPKRKCNHFLWFFPIMKWQIIKRTPPRIIYRALRSNY